MIIEDGGSNELERGGIEPVDTELVVAVKSTMVLAVVVVVQSADLNFPLLLEVVTLRFN